RERVARRAGAAHHLVEPAVAEENLADREQRPLLSHDVQGAGDRAGTGFGTGHEAMIPPKLDFWTQWRVMSSGGSRSRTNALGGLVENRRVTAVVGVLSLAVFMSSP